MVKHFNKSAYKFRQRMDGAATPRSERGTLNKSPSGKQLLKNELASSGGGDARCPDGLALDNPPRFKRNHLGSNTGLISEKALRSTFNIDLHRDAVEKKMKKIRYPKHLDSLNRDIQQNL